ncbi:N-acetylglucosamine-6-phosphate deacetylase [Acidicapsa dinghuensis]|uniref:N-acetylglucosamine-6-phosphate deacetylase n=1 Tax=Acidicapsa dinghuensis TaxID=2218256 RepID=A0ABW1ELS1_9BACT|nr:N-acetylglucosamine-6-phosphate deacetylase [Acidicapsa dinghuensis]
MRTEVSAALLWDGTTLTTEPVIEFEDGKVTSIRSRAEKEQSEGAQHIDFPGAVLAPAFLDIHIHGAAGHDVMEATPESLSAVSRFLASRGTGKFLATTVTAPLDTTLRSLEGLSRRLDEAQKPDWAGARPLGIHLEGPFLSHSKRGVHPPEYLLTPDIALFDRMFEAAEGKIRLLTLAPELPGAEEFAAHVASRGVRVSVGHSNATAAETHRVIAAGATSATHTFNAMRPLDHREPGILGTVLSTDSLYAELICDGIHVDPSLISVWWRSKGAHRAILVTDAMSAAGMPDGEYTLGGFPVTVANGRASANGVLAGSVLTLDRAVKNFVAFTGVPIETVLPLVTQNPAAMTGLQNVAGDIRTGGPADFVALGKDGQLLASFVSGERAA